MVNIYKERIKPLFDKSGLMNKVLEEEIGIPEKKISDWNAGRLKSYNKYIPQIASYFHVSADYLLGKTDDPRPVGEQERPAPMPTSKPLYPPEYDLLSPEDKNLVDNMIRSLAKKKSFD